MPDADIQDVLTYANAVAALNCRALGACGGVPTSDEVERLLMVRPQV
jgi:sugar/nucleoside kinase (ribokinase family)